MKIVLEVFQRTPRGRYFYPEKRMLFDDDLFGYESLKDIIIDYLKESLEICIKLEEL